MLTQMGGDSIDEVVCTTRTSNGFWGTETYNARGQLIEVCSRPRERPHEVRGRLVLAGKSASTLATMVPFVQRTAPELVERPDDHHQPQAA